MRAITVETSRVALARSLYSALMDFHPELAGSEGKGYRVSVELGSSETRVFDVMSAIEEYVTDANDGPARMTVDGQPYTMHAVSGGS